MGAKLPFGQDAFEIVHSGIHFLVTLKLVLKQATYFKINLAVFLVHL